MKDHKELNARKLGMDLVLEIYDITKAFPKEEMYGLTAQIRRSAVSIPSNLSEGAARNTDKEFSQFLHIALGSASELETLLIIARRLNYVADIDLCLDKVTAVKKLISGLIRHYRGKKR